jgi:hypothetical protein
MRWVHFPEFDIDVSEDGRARSSRTQNVYVLDKNGDIVKTVKGKRTRIHIAGLQQSKVPSDPSQGILNDPQKLHEREDEILEDTSCVQ